MAKLNPCFKKIFIFFNVIFALLGISILVLGALSHALSEEFDDKFKGVLILCVTGAVTFIISALGAYGALKENKYVLIAFFTFLCTGTVIIFRIAVPMAMAQAELGSVFQDHLKGLMPLDQAGPDVQHGISVIQYEYKCCGMFKGYRDWGNVPSSVPQSCDCVSDQCEDTHYIKIFDHKTRMVYKEPCGPILTRLFEKLVSITVGVLFGLAVLSLLGAVISLAMIIRISADEETPVPAFSLSYQPPKYSELDVVR